MSFQNISRCATASFAVVLILFSKASHASVFLTLPPLPGSGGDLTKTPKNAPVEDQNSDPELTSDELNGMKNMPTPFEIPEAMTRPNGDRVRFVMTNGIQFSSNQESNDKNKIFKDANYFAQFYYAFEPGVFFGLDTGFAVELAKTFSADGESELDPSEATTSLNTVSEADSIKLAADFTLNLFDNVPWIDRDDNSPIYQSEGVFAEVVLGGSFVSLDGNQGSSQKFDWEPKAFIGIGNDQSSGEVFQAAFGGGYFERLPTAEWRSIINLRYARALQVGDLPVGVQLSAEFNGLFQSGEEEAIVRVGVTVNPAGFLKKVGGAFDSRSGGE